MGVSTSVSLQMCWRKW